MGREHVHLLPWWVSASGEVIIRKIGEWVQDAGWETDNSVRHGRQAAVKAVNRSDLWHPYGHLEQRESGGYWIPPPQIMINGNFEMWRKEKAAKPSSFVFKCAVTSSVFVFIFLLLVESLFCFSCFSKSKSHVTTNTAETCVDGGCQGNPCCMNKPSKRSRLIISLHTVCVHKPIPQCESRDRCTLNQLKSSWTGLFFLFFW